MSQAIYKWHGDLFCSGCIVATMLDHEPWMALEDSMQAEPGLHEEQLDAIAEHFSIDRDQSSDDFPQRVTEITSSICSGCLGWFA